MKKRILCFGDSNTWGYNAETDGRFDDDVRWTGVLRNLLGDDYTVIEEGLCGRTTVWDDPVENVLSGLTYLHPCLSSHDPLDMVVILLGTNDTKPRYGVSPRSVAQGAGRLVEEVMNSKFAPGKKAPQVLLIAPPLIEVRDMWYYIFDEKSAEKSRSFSAEFRRIADEFGCHYLDCATVTPACDLDGVHFDADGHRALAQAVYAKITEILK